MLRHLLTFQMKTEFSQKAKIVRVESLRMALV